MSSPYKSSSLISVLQPVCVCVFVYTPMSAEKRHFEQYAAQYDVTGALFAIMPTYYSVTKAKI